MKRKLLIPLLTFCVTAAMILSAGYVFAAGKQEDLVDPAKGQVIKLKDDTNSIRHIKFSAKPNPDYYLLFKIKPIKNGALIFSLSGTGYTRLLNSKRKPISSREEIVNPGEPDYKTWITYGVKRNKTYYIKSWFTDPLHIGNAYVSAGACYTIPLNFPYGKSAKKAARIKKGKEKAGFIEAGGKAKYYKFNSNQKVVKLTFTAFTNSALRATATFRAKGKKLTQKMTIRRGGNSSWVTFYYIKGKKKFKVKGNCIIKVSPAKKGASGGYSLKWK